MRAVLGSNFVSGQRWSSRCSTCSSEAISSGVGTSSVIALCSSRKRSSAEPGQPRGDAIDLFARQLLAGADLLDDVSRRLGQECIVAELSCGALEFLLRG